MNVRKNLFYIFLVVIGLILLFNLIINPILFQNNFGMGMGMGLHAQLYGNNVFFYRLIFFIAVILTLLFLYALSKLFMNTHTCAKCGLRIEEERWKICPRCGSHITKRKGAKI